MLIGLTRKVTLAAIVFLVLIAIVTAVVLLTTVTVQEATSHLSDEVLPQIDIKGDFNTSMAQAIGEIEAFAYSQEPIKLSEAQEFLTEAEEELASLHTIATTSQDAANEPNEYAANQQLLQQQTAALEAAHGIVANLTPANATPASEIVEQVDQVAADLETSEEAVDRLLQQHRANATQVLATSARSVAIAAGVLGIVCAGLTLLALYVLRRAIMQPVVALATLAQQVADGHLEQRISATGSDEIGTLQRSFNTMVATLQRQTEQLQQEVEAAEAARALAEAARAEIATQLQTIEDQRTVIRETSVPILPLSKTAFMMPLIGTMDTARLQIAQQRALQTMEKSAATHAVMDVTGVPLIDSQVGRGLLDIIQAARLIGTETILVGIRPEVAQTLVQLGIGLDQVVVLGTLQDGIAYVLRRN